MTDRTAGGTAAIPGRRARTAGLAARDPAPRRDPGHQQRLEVRHPHRADLPVQRLDLHPAPRSLQPGDTSRIIHDRLLDGTIPLKGRTYAAIGVGLGVEAVIAGTLAAREVYAADIHPDSVATATAHYQRIVGHRPDTLFRPLVSNLFEQFPDSARLDVITFNPPAVSTRTSDDPTVVRNVCAGTDIVLRFFDQLATRNLLAPHGEIHLTVSNTAELTRIIRHGIDAGFHPAIQHRQTWDGDNCQAYLFKLTRHNAA